MPSTEIELASDLLVKEATLTKAQLGNLSHSDGRFHVHGGYEESATLFELVYALTEVLWRWVGVIAAITIVSLSLTWLFLQNTPSVYVAQTDLLFDYSRQRAVSDLPVDAVLPSIAVLNTELEILTSRRQMDVVATRYGLENDPEFNPWLETEDVESMEETAVPSDRIDIGDAVVTNLMDRVRVDLVPNAYVFSIVVETQSPSKSAAIANGIAETFIEGRSERRRAASEEVINWLETRAESSRQRLQEAEARVATQRTAVAPGTESSLVTIAAEIASLSERLTELEALEERSNNALALMQDLAEADDPREAVSTALDTMNTPVSSEIRELIEQETDLPAPRLQALLDQSKSYIEERSNAASEEIRELEAELASLRDTYEDRNAEVQTLRDFEREAAASLAAYEGLLERVKSRAAVDALDPFWPEAQIISPAVPSVEAASPDRQLFMALGGIAGLTLGSGLALILNALMPVITSSRHAERTAGISNLAHIPSGRRAALKPLQMKLGRDPSGFLAQSLRRVRIAIAGVGSRSKAQIILVASSERSGFNRIVGYLLAQSYLQGGQRVLVVDADPEKKAGLDDRPHPNLISVLRGNFDQSTDVQIDETSGVDYVIVTTRARDEADVFSSGRRREDLYGATMDYRAIIIVAPPVSNSADSELLAAFSDACLLAVAINYSRPSDLAEAAAKLRRAQPDANVATVTVGNSSYS